MRLRCKSNTYLVLKFNYVGGRKGINISIKLFEESGNPSTSFNFDEKFSMGIANRIKFDRSNVPFYLPKLCLNSKLFEEGRDRNAIGANKNKNIGETSTRRFKSL